MLGSILFVLMISIEFVFVGRIVMFMKLKLRIIISKLDCLSRFIVCCLLKECFLMYFGEMLLEEFLKLFGVL